jgi:glycosyltransferase involved in cell wall biosynthesis
MSAAKISACIACRNEADKLAACLASLSWVDEIIVMDLDSDDASRDVALEHGARVIRHAAVPIVELVRNEIAASATFDWILVLDPDERLADGAVSSLRRAAADPDCHAVIIPRTNYDFGHPPSHWSQRYEPQLRMYRRSEVTWPTVPNALPNVEERHLVRLPSADEYVIRHERSRNIVEVLDRSIRYAPAQARSMLEHGERFSAAAMFRALWTETDRKLLTPRAWQDGLPGLIRAAVLVSFKFHVWTELWQQSGGARTKADDAVIRRAGYVLGTVRWMVGGARLTQRALVRARGIGGARRG